MRISLARTGGSSLAACVATAPLVRVPQWRMSQLRRDSYTGAVEDATLVFQPAPCRRPTNGLGWEVNTAAHSLRASSYADEQRGAIEMVLVRCGCAMDTEVNMTASPTGAVSAETLEQMRSFVFAAQSLAVRFGKPTEFDDINARIATVRDALDEIDLLLPTPDEVANYDLRQGCALLQEALDVVEDADSDRLPRHLRRHIAVLNARAAHHLRRGLDRLDTVTQMTPNVSTQRLNLT